MLPAVLAGDNDWRSSLDPRETYITSRKFESSILMPKSKCLYAYACCQGLLQRDNRRRARFSRSRWPLPHNLLQKRHPTNAGMFVAAFLSSRAPLPALRPTCEQKRLQGRPRELANHPGGMVSQGSTQSEPIHIHPNQVLAMPPVYMTQKTTDRTLENIRKCVKLCPATQTQSY